MIEVFGLSGLINGIGALSFGLLIFHKNRRELINRIFFLLMCSIAVWSFSYWHWLSNSKTLEQALFWVRILSIGSLFIPVFYFHWVLLLLKEKKTKFLIFVYLLAFIFLLFSFSDLFIKTVRGKSGFLFWPDPGILYNIYLGFIYVGIVLYSLYLLYKKFINDKESRGRIFYVILGSVLGFGGGIFNFFLWYDIPIKPYGNFLVVFFSICFGYAMLRYKLFNVKIITAEFLTFLISILLLIRSINAKTLTDIVVDWGVLVFFVFAGILLIKNVSKEVEQKEALEKLSKDLEIANVELQRLDAAKSEFVSIVSHQLRTPLTAVKGYISMMQEGTYGKLKENQQDVLEKVFKSSERLIAFINDLLNLNRIEDGRISYAFQPVDMAQMADDIVFDMKSLADFKKLNLTWLKPHGLPKAWADPDKISQTMINFIDNSIKYTAQGSVNVSLKLEENYLVFRVKDTGVGMDAEEKSNLFKKFVRGQGGRMMYTTGTGLGLYVAKLISEAHHGFISGESEGKEKGSTFAIKIPTEEYAKRNNINQEQPKPTQPSQSTQPTTPPSTK
jgi:signal transduction histidine kinase